MTTDTCRSVSNALAKFEANIAKSADAQCMSFLTNVATYKKNSATVGQRRVSVNTAGSMTIPKPSHRRASVGNNINNTCAGAQVTGSIGRISRGTDSWEGLPRPPFKKHPSSRILTAVQKFEKVVFTSSHNPPTQQSFEEVKRVAIKLSLRDGSSNHATTEHRVPRPRIQTQTTYEYDYKETQKVWRNRTDKQRSDEYRVRSTPAQEHEQQWSPEGLKDRRRQLQQQSLAQRMPKRGSMGLVGTVSQEFKPKDLYPSIREEILNRRSSGLRSYYSTCSTEDTRSHHRRTRRRRTDNETKPPPAWHNKPKRRNSTGCVRLSEEPIVTIYWNPAGRDDNDDDMAQRTWRHDEHALCTEDFKDTPSTERHEAHKEGSTVHNLERKGLIRRRKSTGCSRFTEEPTHWLYGREDHEIVEADIPSEEKKAEAKKAREKVDGKQRKNAHQGLGKPSRKASQTLDDLNRKEMKHAEEAVRKGQEAANQAALDHPQGIVMLKQAIPVHEDSAPNIPLRRIERRGSTGAVPLADEPESRLHRKQKIRRELKRSSGLLREQKSVFRHGRTSPYSFRKASVIGLLDPFSTLPDSHMDPRWYSIGGEHHFCTFDPSHVQRKPSVPPSEAFDSCLNDRTESSLSQNANFSGAMLCDEIDEDSDIDHSGHSVESNGSDHPVRQLDNMRAAAAQEESASSPCERGSKKESDHEGAVRCPTNPTETDGTRSTKLRSGRAKLTLSKPHKLSVSTEASVSDDIYPKGWGFSIVEPGYKVARYIDTRDGNRIKTEVTTGSIPLKAKVAPRPRKGSTKKRETVQESIDDDDDDDDSSISSFDSTASPSTALLVSAAPVVISKGTTAATSGKLSAARRLDQAQNGPDVMVPERPPVRMNIGKSNDQPNFERSRNDQASDDEKCSSKNAFVDHKNTSVEPLLCPGAVHDISFEKEKALLSVLQDMQTLPHDDRPTCGRKRTQSRPNAQIDEEIRFAVEDAGTKNEPSIQKANGRPGTHKTKTISRMKGEGKKKDNKKRNEKERRPKKGKSKDISVDEKVDQLSVEQCKDLRTAKVKVTRKDYVNTEIKKDTNSKNGDCSDKHGMWEHADGRTKKPPRCGKSSNEKS